MKESIQVGFGRADITPEEYGPMGGFGNDDVRICTEILDRLFGTCIIVKDSAGEAFALCATDLLNPKESTVVATCREAVNTVTGIDPQRIMVAAAHNHSGPATWSREIEFTDRYLDLFYKQMVKAARDAMEDLKDTTVLAGKKKADRMNFVRHYVSAEGQFFGSGFGSNKGGLVGHADEADEYIQLIRFVREGGRDIILVNWQAHVTFIGYNETDSQMSADYVGVMRNHLEGMTGCHVAFFQGACGNLAARTWVPNAGFLSRTETNYKNYGKRLAETALSCLEENMAPAETGGVRCMHTHLHVPIDHTEDHRYELALEVRDKAKNMHDPKERTAYVQANGFHSRAEANALVGRYHADAYDAMELNALSIGDVAFATFPFEMFSSNGAYIKEHAPFDLTFVMAYCNGSLSYIADEKAWRYPCYEVCNRRYIRGSGEIIAEKAVEMLRQIKN